MLTEGWKPVGGIGFNAGFPYLARVATVTNDTAAKPKAQKEQGL